MDPNNQKTYTCPMHPEILRDKPGMCPECGMALVAVKYVARNMEQGATREEHATSSMLHDTGKEGHECCVDAVESHLNHGTRNAEHGTSNTKHSSGSNKHAGHKTTSFLAKFWVSLVLTVPVVLYSDLPKTLFGWEAPQFPGSRFVVFVLGSTVFFYGGWIFIASARRELRARLPGMMTLIAIAISAAYAFSIYAFLSGSEHTLFWELTTLISIMLLGHWIEMKSVQGAQGALKELSKLLPDTAEVINHEARSTEHVATKIVPLAELKEGDLVFVRPGGKIPADGKVVDGKSDVNESIVTGESRPVQKNIDAEVIAGTSNGDGALTIRVTKIGEHTFLAGVMRLIDEAQASKSRLQILSDKAAFVLTIVAVVAGGVTFVAWLLAAAGFSFAVERLVAVLVVACPHALGLAIPLVASISTTLAARHGFLVKQRLALEAARSVGVVLFDKTGTLTKGEYGVAQIIAKDEKKALELAASVDSHSEHFVSRAIVAEAKKRGIELKETKDFERLPGKGAKGVVDGSEIFVGGEKILDEIKATPQPAVKEKIDILAKEGKTIIYAATRDEILGIFALADMVREESREAIVGLKAAGIRTAMITGDSEEVAKWAAKELGIDEYFAKVMPGEKAAKVKSLQERGLKVAMVGDGINDAPALTQADLGIAIGAGTNVAIESAGIILVRNDPRDILRIIKLSRLTYKKMLQNLFWATGYNVVALPLAAGALAFKGIILTPAIAAIFMSLSTVIVAVNAVMLRRAKL